MKGGEVKVNYKIILPALLIAGSGLIFLTVATAQAQTNQANRTSLVQAIAQRFGLQESDVQSVFDENRNQHQAQMQAKFEDRLTQAVTDGKITEEQKQAILTKRQELQTAQQDQKTNWQNMTADERKQAMQTQQQDLQTWATQNGIDLKSLGGLGLGGFVRGGYKGMRFGK